MGFKVLKDRGIVTEEIRKMFDSFVNSIIESGDLKELEFGGSSPCISRRGIRVD